MHKLFMKTICWVLLAAFGLMSVATAQNNLPGLRLADVQQKDWFLEGQAAADRDYTGGGALVGGLVSGVGLGLIGWGLGYLIVSNMSAEVPHRHLASLSTSEKESFKDGYTQKVKKTRKSSFSIGAGIGTLVAVVLLLSSSGD